MDIGSKIREMRKASGMSQMRLADKVGVSYQQIQKYEKGASKLSVPRLMQLAEIFQVPFGAFLDDEGTGVASSNAVGSNLDALEIQLLMNFLQMDLKQKRLAIRFIEVGLEISRV